MGIPKIDESPVQSIVKLIEDKNLRLNMGLIQEKSSQ